MNSLIGKVIAGTPRWLDTVYAKIGLAIFACLCAGEIFFRTLGFASPVIYTPTAAGYEVRPNQHIRFLFKDIDYNSDGMRTPEIQALPEKNVRRILFLGDSITYGGTQINDAETYPVLFQSLSRNTEALNASAGGWSTFNEEKWLEAHGLHASSLLVLQMNENDLFQPFAPSSTVGSNVNFPGERPLLATSNLLARYVLPKLGAAKAIDPGAASDAVDFTVAANVIAAVDHIRTYAVAHKADMVILYIDPKQPSQSRDFIQARTNLFAYASKNGIPVIRPELNNLSDASEFYRDSIHPNASGNQKIAIALAAALNRTREDVASVP